MKRILIIATTLLLCLSLPKKLYAGEDDWYIGIGPSYYINPFSRTLEQGAYISLEKERSNRHLWGFSFNAMEKNLYFDGFSKAKYNLMGYYKPYIGMGKNSMLYLGVGGNIGTEYQRGITFGLNLSLEYNITFRNRLKLFASLDNILSFRSTNNLFTTGLSVGIKIPLTR